MRKGAIVVALSVVLVSAAVLRPALTDLIALRVLGGAPNSETQAVRKSAYMEAFLEWVGDYIMDSTGGLVESQLAAIDKLIAGRKELAQAEMNMSAAVDSSERFAEANDKYNNAPERTCRVLNEEVGAAQAMVLVEVNRKAATRIEAARLSGVDSAAQANAAVMQEHMDYYCSAADVERGLCKYASNMPNADVTASTLFSPEGGDTLSLDQKRAAVAFYRMATVPVPAEHLPKGLESTAAGQRYLLEQKQAAAMDSMVSGTFARIVEARSPRN